MRARGNQHSYLKGQRTDPRLSHSKTKVSILPTKKIKNKKNFKNLSKITQLVDMWQSHNLNSSMPDSKSLSTANSQNS